MIQIPPETQIKSTIKPGSVYYFEEVELSSDEPHYFIVISSQPKSDRIILLVCSSSQVQKTQYRLRHIPKTHVEISKDEYEGFSKNSIVDCNDVFCKSVDQIIDKLENYNLKIKPEMDISIIEKLRNAVLESPRVDPEIQDMLVD